MVPSSSSRNVCLFLLLATASFVCPASSCTGNERLITKEQLSVVADTGRVTLLNRRWRLDSTSTSDRAGVATTAYSIDAVRVPGDLISDLLRAGLVDDPYYDRNFLTQRDAWTGPPLPSGIRNGTGDDGDFRQRTRTWVYSTNVTLNSTWERSSRNGQELRNEPPLLLVVEGIKMGASIAFNGQSLGVVTDQFLRYIFTVPAEALQVARRELQHGTDSGAESDVHSLTVTFGTNDPNLYTNGRFMACSGGWDWAPYTQVFDEERRRAYTLGIVQPIYLLHPRHVILTDVVPKIYPISSDTGYVRDFRVQVEMHLQIIAPVLGEATSIQLLVSSNFSDANVHVPLDTRGQQVTTVVVNMTASNVDLWWPNGLGAQTLYEVSVSLEDGEHRAMPTQTVRKRIGFRTVELVTSNSTSQSGQHGEGTGDHGMYFRVNGIVIWCRGANMIPMDQLEGRFSDEGHRLLVRSTAMANMNMIRVWGGGIILPTSFYDACDEYGILLYHDLMFVEEHKHGALESEPIKREIVGIVRKLACHPSIVLLSACNECRGSKVMDVYGPFVMQTVAEEDDTRAIWPSSPSQYGWSAGVHMATGKPNGRPLVVRNESARYNLETHGPYQRGNSDSSPGVNFGPKWNENETHTPPKFADMNEGEEGVSFPNTFVSEFGASGMLKISRNNSLRYRNSRTIPHSLKLSVL